MVFRSIRDTRRGGEAEQNIGLYQVSRCYSPSAIASGGMAKDRPPLKGLHEPACTDR
jgi:hypothetical protein